MKTLAILCAIFSLHAQNILQWDANPDGGMYCNLSRIAEWIYCVKENGSYKLYVNMTGAYRSRQNPFTTFFQSFEDPQIFTIQPEGWVVYQTHHYPREFVEFSKFPTDGMSNFADFKWVYGKLALYSDPDFQIFRDRLYPIIQQYIKPVPSIQERIDAVMKKMEGSYKVGIHVRCYQHYIDYEKTGDAFLNDIEKDIEALILSRDPSKTQFFLATLVEPLVERITSKYKNVHICDIPRAPDAWADWTELPHTDDLNAGTDAIVDGWCLAGCDEVWGGTSNMLVFVGCLNPKLKINILPSLNHYDGY